MQESFEVSSSSGAYRVVAGSGLLQQVVAQHPSAIFIIDERLESALPKSVSSRIVIEATESNKSLEYIPEVIIKLRELGANRGSHLVAIGGGVIQDIVTFAASIYMRGVSWTYMPTTLLSMADSCVGGKSSVNVLGYKNLVGNIYPPKDVLIDIDFVETLDAEKIVGGLYEAAKICYARGYQDFVDYLSEGPAPVMPAACVQRVIMRALRTKVWFIEIDEFDKKERLLLNFGHTFGHALEAGTDFGITHGIAVGVGVLVAIVYAMDRGCLNSVGVARSSHLVTHVRELLGIGIDSVVPFPPQIDLERIMEKFDNDKKHRSEHYRVVIPQGDGALELVSELKNDDTRNRIRRAYSVALGEIGWSVFPAH